MAPRRRPVLPALLALTALVTVPAMIGSGSAADDFTGVRFTAAGMQSPPGASTETFVADQTVSGLPPLLAEVGGIQLLVPAHDVVFIGYHEASYDDAMGLSPDGRVVDNQNTTKFTAPVDDLGGTDYTVLSSRGRPHGATTAVDIVLAPGVEVLSPVSGVVTDVRPYLLYGKHDDVRIELQPDQAPGLRVVLIHVKGVDIKAGDVVEAGVTVLAQEANLFPFSSQIDRYTEPNRFAHVHLEVKPPGGAVTD